MSFVVLCDRLADGWDGIRVDVESTFAFCVNEILASVDQQLEVGNQQSSVRHSSFCYYTRFLLTISILGYLSTLS